MDKPEDSSDNVYTRARLFMKEPDCWPLAYRESKYPFPRMKVGQKKYIDLETREEGLAMLRLLRYSRTYWRNKIGVDFSVAGRWSNTILDIDPCYEIRIIRLK